MLCARCGPYHLSVSEELDHRIVWCVGEGDVGEVNAVEGLASDLEAAKGAALTEARRRLEDTFAVLDDLERDLER